jgi:hypothetical protein
MNTIVQILEPWIPLGGKTAEAWEEGLVREIMQGHPLYGVSAKALASQGSQGIYQLVGHDCQFAIVERTYSLSKEQPEFTLYRDAQHLMAAVFTPQHAEWRDEMRAFILERGHFTIQLAPHGYDIQAPLPVHEQVLRPLLGVADECWVYGLTKESPLWSASSDILEPHRGKHRIRTDAEAILGHELLWNSRSGKRGTIVIVIGIQSLLTARIFQHCPRPVVTGNMGAGHTPSALRFAKEVVRGAEKVALLFPRNNGLEWVNILAAPALAFSLFERAYSENNGRHYFHYD